MSQIVQAKYYRAFLFTMAGFCLYIMMLPLVSYGLHQIWPALTQCSFAALFARPCPFCGGTRLLGALYRQGITAEIVRQPLFWVAGGIVAELASRVFLLVKWERLSKKALVWDFVVQAAFAAALTGYIIWFFFN